MPGGADTAASPLRAVRRAGRRKEAPRPQRDVDEADEDGHLDERPDHPGERLAARHPEHPDGDGDGQLEVVAGRGERQRGRPLVAEVKASAEEEGAAQARLVLLRGDLQRLEEEKSSFYLRFQDLLNRQSELLESWMQSGASRPNAPPEG